MAERRLNALTGEWVIVSSGRLQRPWQGETAPAPAPQPQWRADCHLCPRSRRTAGSVNPDYAGVYVFDNDFPALPPSSSGVSSEPLLLREAVAGKCRVVCYSPRHDMTLATLDARAVAGVIESWTNETTVLAGDHAWVQVFENKGRMMGCSSDHPHGQIWATTVVPTIAQREDERQQQHAAAHGTLLLLDYVERELMLGERVVDANGSWAAVVPFWAAWPFEVMLLPRSRVDSFESMSDASRDDLRDLLMRTLAAYDRLFGVSFPYSMGWHGRGRTQGPHWQLHAHFYPPLLRSPTIRKFMVGFEMLAEAQRDLTPEEAAARLREVVS